MDGMEKSMTTTTDTARAVLLDLETKLTAAKSRHDETQSDAQAIAFSAFVDGGEARKRLDKLNADAAKHGAEIMSLEAAIGEARRRVNEALAADADDVSRDKAQQALLLLDAFAERGAELDAALAEFLEKYAALTRDFRQLDALGYAPTTWPLVKINMQAAVATRLQFTDLRQAFLAPHERRDFVTVISGWSNHVRARATARLNRNKDAAKAA
jgi:hypothetical protein